MPRVVVISDIHGNFAALQAVFRDYSRRKTDHVLFLGDLVAFGPRPMETVEFLKQEVKPSVALRGNTDRYLLENVWADNSNSPLPDWIKKSLQWTSKQLGKKGLQALKELVDEQGYSIDGFNTYLCHASPGDDELGVEQGKAAVVAEAVEKVASDLVLCGHTHIPYRTRIGKSEVVNVGSVGFPFDRDARACYLSFFVGHGALREISFSRVSYSMERAVSQLIASGMPGFEVPVHRLQTSTNGMPRASAVN